jgi:Domain of unknown function (DUF4111)
VRPAARRPYRARVALPDAPTPFPDLDEVLAELTVRARDILGADFVGGYLQGSFALGDGDMHSDCDFVTVVAQRPSGAREVRLRALHDELPTRDGHWYRHLEGSYATADDLTRLDVIGADWLYVDHGARGMEWSAHCNSAVARWILREWGITLAGPPPASLVAPVPADLLRDTMRRQLPTLMDDLHSWADFDVAWTQRYTVATYCRMLYTLDTGRVASKPRALRWAMSVLDPRWRPLLTQVLDDRSRGLDFTDPPRPGSIESTVDFAAYAVSLAER